MSGAATSGHDAPAAGALVVGAGLMGRWHAEALRRAGVPVRIVVDPRVDRARRLARKVGAEASTELPEALAMPDVGSVHVCVPPGSHFDVAAAALEAGKHVLVEKPATEDVAATEELLRRAAARGLLLCPVYQCLFQRGVVRVIDRLDRLGRLRHLDALVQSAGAEGRGSRGRDRIAAEILPHGLSLMERFLAVTMGASVREVRWQVAHPEACNSPGAVSRGADRDRPEAGIPDRGATPGDGGVTVLVRVSMAGRPRTNRFRVVGDRATAHMDLFHGFSRIERLPATRAGKLAHPFAVAAAETGAAVANLGGRLLRRQLAYPGLWELVAAFHEAVRSGGEPPVAPAETLAVARARSRIVELAGIERMRTSGSGH